MARYDYRCPECGTEFEVEHPMSERPVIVCPSCGAKAQQLFGASSIVFKGSGFYNTDQRGKSGATSATSAPKQSAEKSSEAPKKSTSENTSSTKKTD